MPVPWIVLFGVQWLAIIVLAVLVMGLSQRLTMFTAAAHALPGSFDLLENVPPVGSPIPHEKELLAPAEERGRTAVLFLSSVCKPCRALSDSLAAVATDPRGRGSVLDSGDELVVVTDPAGVDAFGHIGRVVVEQDGELSRALGVKGTPVGFGVEQDGTLLGASLLGEIKDVVQLLSEDRQPAPFAP